MSVSIGHRVPHRHSLSNGHGNRHGASDCPGRRAATAVAAGRRRDSMPRRAGGGGGGINAVVMPGADSNLNDCQWQPCPIPT